MKTSSEIIAASLAAGVLTEKDCNLLFRRMNNGKKDEIDFTPIWDNCGIDLTPEQSEKGRKWLMSLYKTPSGKERINNPFGYREIAALENFSHCKLIDYFDAGNAWIHFYVPVYQVVGGAGAPSFDYYMKCGQICICG